MLRRYLLVLLMVVVVCPVFAEKVTKTGMGVFSQDDLDFLNQNANTDQFYAEQVKRISQQVKKNDAFYSKVEAIFQGDRPINSRPFKPELFVEEITLPQVGIPVLTEEQAIQERYSRAIDRIDKKYEKRRKARNKEYQRKAWKKRNQVTIHRKFTPKVYTGPRGGKYTVNKYGYKRYIKR